ncbi:hypothetical protein IYZ83_005665 [Wolbachia pipientis]|uniref:hypothetical protein n=1 Tax=Wolbachia pipientis TaxID=955 RepID=UPI001BDB6A8A|nr:hypothetical protein [Wolbachia pipientis]UIP91601.1 hypothetical protein IYZ83_005665 [Wolbachia pipientis]
MLKNTFPYSNYKHSSHVNQLPRMLKINLHTKLDDGKDPKFEINDKTKNELKEKIKNELEKDLKFEIGDKTKNEIKDKIKKEIEDEIDYKRDKNGHDKGDKDKDGFNKDGYDKDDYNEKGFDKNGYNRKGFDEDGKKKGDNDDGSEVTKTAFILSQEITDDHADSQKCGVFGGYYKTYNQIGRHGFSTSELLEAFHPEMYSNPKIAEHLEAGSRVLYGAVNYKFAFSEPFDYSWGSASNMWCKKCSDIPNEVTCQDDGIKSFCYPAGLYANQNYNKSFFADRTCPNLVKISGTATIKAKQVAPLILVNSSGEMINKEGDNTKVNYSNLLPYFKANGHIKDCTGDANCKSFIEIMKKVAWDTDKEILLKTVLGDTQGASPYYEDNSVSNEQLAAFANRNL